MTKILERWWPKVDKRGPDECWEWTGSKNRDGYGRFRDGPPQKAHRVSYKLFCGPVPDGAQVLHKCDNPGCVNPRHLFLGDHIVNMQDMASKGRASVTRGTDNPNAKLTDAKVIAIRERYKAGGESLRKLAKEFGVSHELIRLIVTRVNWTHLTR